MSDVFQMLWDAPLSSRGTMRFGGGVDVFGLEHGALSVIGAQEVPGLGTVLVLHEEGRKYWSSRGAQGYAGASVWTVLVESVPVTTMPLSSLSSRYVRLADVSLPRNADERLERTANFLGRVFVSA